MNSIIQITPLRLAAGYLLLLLPCAIILSQRVPIFRRTVIAVVRMTAQLLLVGLYLHVIFDLNSPWLNIAWLVVMISVADMSILRSCRLSFRACALPLLGALCVGTFLPASVFIAFIINVPSFFDAQYLIPLSGMILGNCLHADIIGLRTFYTAMRTQESTYQYMLAQGATFHEAVRPFIRDALESALLPTLASMATIGLVALPGMMTGTILAGADPLIAVTYQIAIMVAIFTGTSLTVFLALYLSLRRCFTPAGIYRDVTRD